MNVTPLEQKTIRPGSLLNYGYYYSDRRPVGQAAAPTRTHKLSRRMLLLAVATMATLGLLNSFNGPASHHHNNGVAAGASAGSGAKISLVSQSANACTNNHLAELIVVSLSERHLWGCQNTSLVYNSPVVTGMSAHVDTITPTGTYHIYAKQTNTTLTGADSTGSWSDPVSYWLPFLSNQYGSYGLHDATWRPADAFGKIAASSSSASHGCIELPLSAAQWLYNWASVGTTVTIES